MTKKIDRREFIKKGSQAVFGTGIALKAGKSMAAGQKGKSRVIEIMDPQAISDNRRVNAGVVRKMLRRSMEAFSGSTSPWSQFLKKSDRVGLKINCLGRPRLFTHHELIQAVADELKEFGIPENNIIVWDRFERHMQDCRFTFNRTNKGLRCYGTVGAKQRESDSDRFDAEMTYKSDFDNPSKRDKGGTVSRIASIFTQECDKIINMAILKDHGLSGVTLCLKNLAYGLCDNNGRFHGAEHIGPFIADFCALPEVRKKVVLHILDGLEACFDTGPIPAGNNVLFTPKTLWLGTDPVALDAVGYKVIDAERKERKLPPLEEAKPSTDHIRLAAKKGLGIDDLDRIKVEKI